MGKLDVKLGNSNSEFFCFVLDHAMQLVGSQFPDEGLNSGHSS